MSALPTSADLDPLLAPAPAAASDAPGIVRLIEATAPDTVRVDEAEVRRHITGYLVVRHRQAGVVATAALRPIDEGRVELRSVAVDEGWRGCGLGGRLVRRAIVIAATAGQKLVCVTLRPSFFEQFGFREVPLESVPEKAYREDEIGGRRRVAMAWRGPRRRRELRVCFQGLEPQPR